MSDQTSVEWRADESGLIGDVRYHDGSLAELAVSEQAVRVVVLPIGGGVTVFEFAGNVRFGSTSLVGGAAVLDVWAFRLAEGSDAPVAMSGAVVALYGGNLRTADLPGVMQHICRENVGRVLANFACVSGEFSVLADRMSVSKSGY